MLIILLVKIMLIWFLSSNVLPQQVGVTFIDFQCPNNIHKLPIYLFSSQQAYESNLLKLPKL